jgi:photosystem II stability/assembly factor-like uncharacterized protein
MTVMDTMTWLGWPVLICVAAACRSQDPDRDKPAPPQVTVTAARADAAPVPDAESAEMARSRTRMEELQRDMAAFDKKVHDPVNRAAGWTFVTLDQRQPGLNTLWGVAVDGDDVVTVGIDSEIHQSRDGGATWTTVDTASLVNTKNQRELISKVWASGERRVAIGFEDTLIAVSSDRGATWKRIALEDPVGTSIEPTGLFGTDKDVYLTHARGVFVSHDRGATWKQTYHVDFPEFTREGVRGITGSRDGADIYAYGSREHDQALLLRSRNHGASWQALRLGKPLQPIELTFQVIVGRDRTVYAHFLDQDRAGGTRDRQLARSSDGGVTWSLQPLSFASADVGAQQWWCAPDDTLYVAVAGPDRNELISSRDHGKTWAHELPFTPQDIAFSRTAMIAVGWGAAWIKPLKH